MTTAVDKLLKTIRDRATDNFTTKLAKYMGKGTLALHPFYRCDTFLHSGGFFQERSADGRLGVKPRGGSDMSEKQASMHAGRRRERRIQRKRARKITRRRKGRTRQVRRR